MYPEFEMLSRFEAVYKNAKANIYAAAERGQPDLAAMRPFPLPAVFASTSYCFADRPQFSWYMPGA